MHTCLVEVILYQNVVASDEKRLFFFYDLELQCAVGLSLI